ncbi:uncharacterized protein LOC125294197 isoform X1 [Alosa alosa]|uniref:uncharacterized protein LOC125294197 isoform X1 n=1 Tax=Alosa alosa TaxID=278164 RepID=UPI0020152F67|nr:uncharacterized protein LOC125294197 isoform X1 [Alosa alosa]
MKMKLSKLFSCCLPIQKQKHRNERVDTNKKKKRKEAKRLKKEMADKRRKEDLEMDISMVQSVETVVMSAEFSKEDCTLNESSIDHGTPQLDEEASKSSFLLHGGGDRARPLSQLKLDWHRHQPGVGKPTAHAGEWRTPDPPEKRDVMEEERRKILRGFFERRGNTTQNATTQATLTTEEEKLTPQPAVWHTAVPGERDEERRKILHGFVKRRGLTTCRPKKEFNK